jgi:hypothetical protein
MKKILAINPKISVHKDHIDYPYYLNVNLYLNLFPIRKDYEIDIFDSFCMPQEFFYGEEDSFIF